MGFNKIYLPDHKELVRMHEDDPTGTRSWLSKADALIGDDKSMKLSEKIISGSIYKRKKPGTK